MFHEIFWVLMVLGLFALGKDPTVWSGTPVAESKRKVELQVQLDVLTKLPVTLVFAAL
jgi:hypothetical protein